MPSDLLHLLESASQKPHHTDDALCCCACGSHLEKDPKVFSLLTLQFPVTVPTDRPNWKTIDGGLEYAVDRLSAHVHVDHRTGGGRPSRQLLYRTVGRWIQAAGQQPSPLAPLWIVLLCLMIGLFSLVLSTSNEWLFLVIFAYLIHNFSFNFSRPLSSGHH